jgi:hypothetical protein
MRTASSYQSASAVVHRGERREILFSIILPDNAQGVRHASSQIRIGSGSHANDSFYLVLSIFSLRPPRAPRLILLPAEPSPAQLAAGQISQLRATIITVFGDEVKQIFLGQSGLPGVTLKIQVMFG